nr:MAG TPA: hypothetical protein [Caudoviricetes sp.]
MPPVPPEIRVSAAILGGHLRSFEYSSMTGSHSSRRRGYARVVHLRVLPPTESIRSMDNPLRCCSSPIHSLLQRLFQ